MALLHFEETVSPGENTENEQGGNGKIQGELFIKIDWQADLFCCLTEKKPKQRNHIFL